jgi:hypothetical protein
MTTYTAGTPVTLTVQWVEYEGGPAVDVTGLTITITTAAGATVLAATSSGVTHVATGLDSYVWATSPNQAGGDYVVIWDATDADGDPVQASEVFTIRAAVLADDSDRRIEALTPTSGLLSIGERWDIAVRADTLPTVTVTLPDGTTSAVEVTEDVRWGTPGCRYRAVYTVATAGRYLAHVATTDDAADFAVYAMGPTTASGMPVAADLAKYMGGADASSWDTEDMDDALAIEAAAQRSVCRVGAVYPDDMRGALLRRAQRNLALRALPLAIPQGDAESGPAILPGRDPEVRRLEAPYRRVTVG